MTERRDTAGREGKGIKGWMEANETKNTKTIPFNVSLNFHINFVRSLYKRLNSIDVKLDLIEIEKCAASTK